MTNLPQESNEQRPSSLQLSSKLSKDDTAILAARNSKQLGELDSSEASQLIMRICALIGCQLPSIEAGMLLWDFVCRHYWTISKKSFELAFEMNAAGKLEKRIEHYNSFDATFVSAVLSEYEKRKREAVKESNKTVHEDHAAELLQEPSEDTMKQLFNDHVEQVRKGKILTAQLLGATMCNWLIRTGQLGDIPDDLNNQWEAKAKEIIFTDPRYQLSAGRWKRLKETKGAEYQRIREHILSEKKRLCYLWYINEQIKKK